MKTNLRQLDGVWDRGFALDKHTLHSEYIGDNEFGHPQFATTRSEVGEALFRLKFRSDYSQVDPLAATVVEQIVPMFGPVDLVVPMLPSKARTRQPVFELAERTANLLGLPYYADILSKLPAPPGTPELKNLSGKEAKTEALKGRFSFNDAIAGEGRWNALIVDDLYDTGASLEAACTGLKCYPKIANIYVATLTWK